MGGRQQHGSISWDSTDVFDYNTVKQRNKQTNAPSPHFCCEREREAVNFLEILEWKERCRFSWKTSIEYDKSPLSIL